MSYTSVFIAAFVLSWFMWLSSEVSYRPSQGTQTPTSVAATPTRRYRPTIEQALAQCAHHKTPIARGNCFALARK